MVEWENNRVLLSAFLRLLMKRWSLTPTIRGKLTTLKWRGQSATCFFPNVQPHQGNKLNYFTSMLSSAFSPISAYHLFLCSNKSVESMSAHFYIIFGYWLGIHVRLEPLSSIHFWFTSWKLPPIVSDRQLDAPETYEIPSEIVDSWKQACQTKSRQAKNAVFQSFLRAGKDWSKFLVVLVTQLFFLC